MSVPQKPGSAGHQPGSNDLDAGLVPGAPREGITMKGVPKEYKQTEVGVIPKEWDVRSFEDLFIITAGGDVNPSQTTTEMDSAHRYPIYSNALTGNGLYGYCTYADHPANSVTITARGTLGSANFRGHEYTAIGRVLVLVSKPQADGRFFTDYINGRVRFAVESTGVPQLTAPQISKYRLAAPPLHEQRAIAEALGDVDALLAALDAQIAKQRDLKQATMQQLLTGQTRLPGFVGEWEETRLGEVADMESGGTPPSSVADYYDGAIPWVSISDMTKGGKIIVNTERNLSIRGLANSAAKMLGAGTVLYTMYASLGECSIAGIPLCTSQAILGIWPKARLDKIFLYYFLNSRKSAVKNMGQQGTQANLNKGMVRDFPLSLPSLGEQAGIVNVLEDIDVALFALHSRRTKTAALKQAMMQSLLTGRIRLTHQESSHA